MDRNNTEINEPVQDVQTDYGAVPETELDSLPKTVRYCTPRTTPSAAKKFVMWFMGIVGCISFLVVCACLVFVSIMLTQGYRFSITAPPGNTGDDDFLYFFDEHQSDSDFSQSDFTINKSSDAGLGIVVVALESAKAETYGIKGGLVISGFTDNNSFEGTDVKLYDIITAAAGKDVTVASDLTLLLSQYEPGDDFVLTITRFTDGYPESFDITVTLIDKTADSAQG